MLKETSQDYLMREITLQWWQSAIIPGESLFKLTLVAQAERKTGIEINQSYTRKMTHPKTWVKTRKQMVGTVVFSARFRKNLSVWETLSNMFLKLQVHSSMTAFTLLRSLTVLQMFRTKLSTWRERTAQHITQRPAQRGTINGCWKRVEWNRHEHTIWSTKVAF